MKPGPSLSFTKDDLKYIEADLTQALEKLHERKIHHGNINEDFVLIEKPVSVPVCYESKSAVLTCKSPSLQRIVRDYHWLLTL